MLVVRVAMFAWLVACHELESEPVDSASTSGSTADSGAPSPTPTPPTEPVPVVPITVVVSVENRDVEPWAYDPAVAATVVFAHPDGTFAGTETSDEEGRIVSELLPEGGSVTWVRTLVTDSDFGRFESRRLHTVFGVNPGETIRLGGRGRGFYRSGSVGFVNFDLSGSPNGTGRAVVYASCGGAISLLGTDIEASVGLRQGCQPGPTDILAVEFTDFTYSEALSFVVGQVTTTGMPLEGDVDLTNWSTEHGRVRITPGNNFGTSVSGRFGRMEIGLGSQSIDETFEVVTHPAFSDVLVESRRSRSTRYDVLAPPAVGQTATLAPADDDFLPAVTVRTSTEAPSPPVVTLAGIVEGDTCGGIAPAMVTGQMGVELSPTPENPDTFVNATWDFVAPFSTRIQLPDLGPENQDQWPTNAEDASTSVTVVADADRDYAVFKARNRHDNDAFDTLAIATAACRVTADSD